ncbi:MAG: hypothetical protein WBV85_01775 [Solirubrobacteraceae bacterium]
MALVDMGNKGLIGGVEVSSERSSTAWVLISCRLYLWRVLRAAAADVWSDPATGSRG